MPSRAPQSRGPEPARVDAQDVARRLRGGEPLLLVCAYVSPVAWGKFALAGAVPLEGLQELLEDLDDQTELVLYCRCPQDRTAATAARRLQEEGLERVRVLAGGYSAALAAGIRPLQRR